MLDGVVSCHPFIAGELACGYLRNRKIILSRLRRLVQAPVVEHDAVLEFIDTQGLFGRGLGYVDVQLLASAWRAKVAVWTLDKRMGKACRRLGLEP